jgi:hypothetical protein
MDRKKYHGGLGYTYNISFWHERTKEKYPLLAAKVEIRLKKCGAVFHRKAVTREMYL